MDSTPVVIVNERFANKFFPGQNVLGKRIKPGFSADETGEKMREIVGVVGNVKHLALKNDDSPEMYLPRTQIPFGHRIAGRPEPVFRIPLHLTSAVRKELAAMDSYDSAHECPSLRRIHFAFFGTAALQRSTIVNLRRNGTFSHCHRDLRRHGLLGFAAHKRNRNSHGARRSAIGHLPARRWTSYDAGRH